MSQSVATLCWIPQTPNRMCLELMLMLMEYTNLNLILCLVLYFKIGHNLLCLTSPERITKVRKYLVKLFIVLVLDEHLYQLKIDRRVIHIVTFQKGLLKRLKMPHSFYCNIC